MADGHADAPSAVTKAPATAPRRAASRDLGAAAREAADRLSRALEAERFAGWDPYDALSSPLIGAVARTRLLRGAAIQALKRSPVNVRPLLGVPKRMHTKAVALLVSAYAGLAALEPDARLASLAAELADALRERAIPTRSGVGWGYDFDVQTRWGYYRAGRPNAVVTSFAAHALLDLVELADPPGAARSDSLDLVDRALAYASTDLLVEERGERYFAYFEGSTTPIHNASLLVASVAARRAEPGSEGAENAEAAIAYTLAHRRPDGSWPYGERRGLEWVDGYHTAYVLEALARWSERYDDPRVDEARARGLDLYLSRLIDPDGAPRMTLTSRYPIDIHCASSGITALSRLARQDPRALQTARRVLAWTLRTMLRRDGRFAFQHGRYLRNSVPYVRWNDAHMLLALASYLTACRDDDAR